MRKVIPDPTAAEAIENVTREEMRKERKPCVFICSPYAGDVTLNIEKAKRYLRFAVDEGANSICAPSTVPLRC